MSKRTSVTAFLRSDFARHGAIVFAASTCVNLASYAFNLVLSRTLGVAGYGSLASLTSLLVLASIPASIFATIVVKQGAELSAVGDTSRFRALALRTFQIAVVGSALAFAIALLARNVIARFLNITDGVLISVAGAVLALAIITTAMRALLQGGQDFRRFAFSTLLEGVLRATFGIALVAIGHDVMFAMVGWLIAEAVAATYTTFATPLFPGTRDEAVSSVLLDWRRIAQTSAGVGMSAAVLTALGFADMILVKHFFSPTVAGLYGALSLGGRVLTFGLGFLPTILLPKATARVMRGESAMPILRAAFGISIAFACTVLAFVAVDPRTFLRILVGSSYAQAAPLALPYCVAVTLLTLAGLVATYKTAIHQFGFVAPAALVAVIELTAICFYHATIGDVIRALLAGNAIVLATVTWGIWKTPYASEIPSRPKAIPSSLRAQNASDRT